MNQNNSSLLIFYYIIDFYPINKGLFHHSYSEIIQSKYKNDNDFNNLKKVLICKYTLIKVLEGDQNVNK